MAFVRKLPYKPRLTRDQRRSVIERMAAQLFAERGYDAVSIEEIAAAAEITKPTLYDHFSSKQQLYDRLLQTQSNEMVNYMADRVNASRGTPAEQLRDVLDAFFAFVQEHPFAWQMLFREPPTDPKLAGAARRIHQQASNNVAALLRRLEPSKRDLPERQLELRAEGLKWAQQGLATWWYDHPEVTRAEIVEAVIAMSPVDLG